MNNNIFDIKRFGKLIYRKWFHPTNFAWRNIYPFMALPVLFLLLNLWGGGNTVSLDSRASVFGLLIVISIVFAPFIYFNNYNHPKKGITDILLPASIFEKYMVMQLTGILFSPILIFIMYGLTDTLLSLLFPGKMNGFAVAEFITSFDTNWEKILIIFTVYQFTLFCNLWFVKNKQLKTFGIFILFHITLISLVIGLFFMFIEEMPHMSNLEFNVYEGSGQSLIIKSGDHPTEIIVQLLRIFVDIVMPISLAVGSYFMLKTKRY